MGRAEQFDLAEASASCYLNNLPVDGVWSSVTTNSVYHPGGAKFLFMGISAVDCCSIGRLVC